MRTQGNLSLKAAITNKDIEMVLNLRQAYDTQKKQLELAENALSEVEKDVMAKIQSGCPVTSSYNIALKTIERRNVAWKSVAADLIGHEATEAILINTPPTITYRLLIKDAA